MFSSRVGADQMYDRLKWQKANTSGTPPAARACHTLTRLGWKLYMFGGYDGTKCFNDIDGGVIEIVD